MTLTQLRQYIDATPAGDVEQRKALHAALDVVESAKVDHIEGRDSHTARAYLEQQLPAMRAFDAALAGREAEK